MPHVQKHHAPQHVHGIHDVPVGCSPGHLVSYDCLLALGNATSLDPNVFYVDTTVPLTGGSRVVPSVADALLAADVLVGPGEAIVCVLRDGQAHTLAGAVFQPTRTVTIKAAGSRVPGHAQASPAPSVLTISGGTFAPTVAAPEAHRVHFHGLTLSGTLVVFSGWDVVFTHCDFMGALVAVDSTSNDAPGRIILLECQATTDATANMLALAVVLKSGLQGAVFSATRCSFDLHMSSSRPNWLTATGVGPCYAFIENSKIRSDYATPGASGAVLWDNQTTGPIPWLLSFTDCALIVDNTNLTVGSTYFLGKSTAVIPATFVFLTSRIWSGISWDYMPLPADMYVASAPTIYNAGAAHAVSGWRAVQTAVSGASVQNPLWTKTNRVAPVGDLVRLPGTAVYGSPGDVLTLGLENVAPGVGVVVPHLLNVLPVPGGAPPINVIPLAPGQSALLDVEVISSTAVPGAVIGAKVHSYSAHTIKLFATADPGTGVVTVVPVSNVVHAQAPAGTHTAGVSGVVGGVQIVVTSHDPGLTAVNEHWKAVARVTLVGGP